MEFGSKEQSIIIIVVSIIGSIILNILLGGAKETLVTKEPFDMVVPLFPIVAGYVILIFTIFHYQILAGKLQAKQILCNKGSFSVLHQHVVEIPLEIVGVDDVSVERLGNLKIMFTGGSYWIGFPVGGKEEDPIIVALDRHIEEIGDGFNVKAKLNRCRIDQVDPYIREAIYDYVDLYSKKVLPIKFDKNITPIYISFVAEFDGSDTDDNLKWETKKKDFNSIITVYEERIKKLTTQLRIKQEIENPKIYIEESQKYRGRQGDNEY